MNVDSLGSVLPVDSEEGNTLNEILLINNSLKGVIGKVRRLLFNEVFNLNSVIISVLKMCEVEYFEDYQRDQIVFSFPLTPVETNIVYPTNSVSSLDLLAMSKDSSSLVSHLSFCSCFSSPKNFEKGDLSNITSIFNSFRGGSFLTGFKLNSSGIKFIWGETTSNIFRSLLTMLSCFGLINPNNFVEFYNTNKFKPRARTKLSFKLNNSITMISLTISKNVFVLAHYNAADFSILSDFNELKKKLSVVNKSFVSLGKPLKFEESFVYFRDTMLLAPAGMNSFKELSKLYSKDGLVKREISIDDIKNMRGFLEIDPERFRDYALHDALITLKHAIEMEVFNMKMFQIGIPLTLSSIGRKFVFKEWRNIFKKHLPYQVSGEFLMGNADEIQTPKGLYATRNIGTYLSHFIANYKGGRNESFMYGVDKNIH